MFDAKKLESLQADIEEVKDMLKTAEERRNMQYTDIMVAIKELAGLLEKEQVRESWEDSDELDEFFEKVRELVLKEKKASTSLIQRRFKIGYGRAARIMEQLEEQGVIEENDGANRPRKVIMPS